MSIVILEDVSDYLNGPTWTPRQQLLITETVIPGVQQELETYLNRPVEPMHVREALQPDCESRAWPTVSPVWRTIAIDYAPPGTPISLQTPFVPPSPLAPILETVREWDPAGAGVQAPSWMIGPGSAYIFVPGWTWDPAWPITGGAYVVTEYVGGYNGYVDRALKLGMLRVIVREVERLFDRAITLRDGAGLPTGPSDPRNKGWSPEELAQFDRLRRRVVVS